MAGSYALSPQRMKLSREALCTGGVVEVTRVRSDRGSGSEAFTWAVTFTGALPSASGLSSPSASAGGGLHGPARCAVLS